MKTKMCRL